MGAPNFYNANAKYIYAVELNDDPDYEMLIEDLHYEFGIEFKNDFIEKDEWDNNRSYEGKIIGRIHKTLGDEQIMINLIVRNGYHAGVNLDWDAEFIVMENDYEENYDLECIDLDKFPNVRDEFHKAINKVEEIYEKLSTPLNKVGQFSNGEAVYEKANN